MSLFLSLINYITVYSNFSFFFWFVFFISVLCRAIKGFSALQNSHGTLWFWARCSPEDIQCERGGLFACTRNLLPLPSPALLPSLPPATNVRCCWKRIAPALSGFSIQGR